ncbi:MAG: hypothetical protein R2795_20810 [Saprospiraceae bacterium]
MLIGLLLGTLLPLSSQQLNEHQQAFLDSVQQRYLQAHSISMEVDVVTFDAKGKTIGEVVTYYSYKQGDHYLIKTPYAFQLLTPNLQLVINHQAQLIRLLPVRAGSQLEANANIILPFFENNGLEGELDWSESNGIVSLQLMPAYEDTQYAYFHFDQEEYLLKGVDYIYPYNEEEGMPRHIRIQYPLIDINQGVGGEALDISDYLEQKNGEWAPKGSWGIYEFIDETKH